MYICRGTGLQDSPKFISPTELASVAQTSSRWILLVPPVREDSEMPLGQGLGGGGRKLGLLK